jgi:glyoxylase-like metal-dependent hydrolase (beta-lactamase superfamily II)
MANWPFRQGVHDLGNGLYGYVQPDGTWGWSNAGLVTSAGETLLVDTLMSMPLTELMLAQFAKLPGGDQIDKLVNTHANPDHYFGNGAVGGAQIISTKAAREEMEDFNPALLANLASNWESMGDAGEFLFETMGRRFDFSGAEHRKLPTRVFEKSLSLTIGEKTVELTDLGPAHTASDTIVWVPEDHTVFTGDLLFNEGHPVVWAGPFSNWIAACDYIEALQPKIVVPGHGPITDVSAVRNLKGYFERLRDEARGRFDAGMDWKDAAADIPIKDYAHWTDPERVVANVYSLYREWAPDMAEASPIMLFAEMNRYRKQRQAAKGDDHAH